MTLGKLQKDTFSWTKAYIKGTWLYFEFLELYSLYCICLRIYFDGIFSQKFLVFFFKIGNLVNICVKCHQSKGPRGEAVMRERGERMSSQTWARSPEVDELSCVPETQQREQAAGVEELVLGVQDPRGMSYTEQNDIRFET